MARFDFQTGTDVPAPGARDVCTFVTTVSGVNGEVLVKDVTELENGMLVKTTVPLMSAGNLFRGTIGPWRVEAAETAPAPPPFTVRPQGRDVRLD